MEAELVDATVASFILEIMSAVLLEKPLNRRLV